MRITDQYFWNFVFSIFFIGVVVLLAIIVESVARTPWAEISFFDYFIMTLATWRLTRLFVYDHVTKWLREQFYDVSKVGRALLLEKAKYGPRRTLADLFSCPWCMSVWMALLVIVSYQLSTYAYFILLLLAMSAVATWLQLISN